MKFDQKLYDEIPKGFSLVHKQKYSGDMSTIYESGDFKIYNIPITIIADLRTEKQTGIRRWFKPKQKSSIILQFDVTPDGLEYEGGTPTTNFICPQDEKKNKTSREIALKISKILKHHGYGVTFNFDIPEGSFKPDNRPSLILTLPQHTTNPFDNFTEIQKLLSKIESQWERGEKPLGDIDDQFQFWKELPGVKPGPTMEEWVARIRGSGDLAIVKDMKDIAEKHLPIGTKLTSIIYDRFEKVLNDYFGQNLPPEEASTVEEIKAVARDHFHLGALVSSANHENFAAALRVFFEPGKGIGF